ncbi:rhodanese-like domain-containing protein [Cyanobacteria bacterium FACHB-DQ100]|nr:rhodanese-like domain-containing protein [Cyanobacteria bacterium FACHB-DQ100]
MRLLFKLLKLWIRFQFPTVRSLSTQDLDRWLQDPNRIPPILLDARTVPEFAVSHLKTAQRIDPRQPNWKHLPKNFAIVVYCSVGYRSAKVAQQLQKHGFTDVWNLEGSIFQWANEARSLYQNNGRLVRSVHPYNARWGKLLNPELRATIDE